MQAGKLRHRITLQAPDTTQDSFGQPTANGFVTVLQAYARVESISRRQDYAVNAGFTANVTHRITIRYTDTTLDSSMQILFGTRRFSLQFVTNPEETRKELLLWAEEQTK